METNDILLYVDGRSHFKANNISFLDDFIESKKFDIAVSRLTSHKELLYTTSEVLNYFKATDVIKNSPQFAATIVALIKNENTSNLIKTWSRVLDEHRELFRDDHNEEKNSEGFIENRHDQSVFSILAKLEEITILSHAENFPRRKTIFAEAPAWRDLKFMPIQARRDKSRFRDRILERIAIVIKVLMNVKIIQKLKSFSGKYDWL
jgi:hypothetical protein